MAEGNSSMVKKPRSLREREREQEGNSSQHRRIKRVKEQKINAQPWLPQKHQEAKKGKSEECRMN